MPQRTFKLFLLAFVLFAVNALAQSQQVFTATSGDVTITSASTYTFTVQQPATGAKMVQLWRATAACDTQAYTVTQAVNGTAASSTAVTPVPESPLSDTSPKATATVTAWKASNVGTGTALWGSLAYSSGIALLDLSTALMVQTGTGTNYSITVTNNGGSSCTGRISISWKEGNFVNKANQVP